MVRRITAQEAHEIAEPVRYPKAEHVGEEAHRRLVSGRMEHDMADAHRNAFPAFDFARGAPLHAARNLERQAVRREEPEPVAAAGRVTALRRMNDAAPRR